MTASAAEVEAAQKESGCERQDAYAPPSPASRCVTHERDWTDRGCTFAVAVADAVVAAAQPRIAAETLREAALAVEAECSSQRGPCFCISAKWLGARADGIEG